MQIKRRAAALWVLVALMWCAGASAQEPPQRSDAPVSAPSTTAGTDDGRFQFVVGAFVTAAGTDIASSMYVIGRGTAREGGFGALWQDSPIALAATKSALTALFVYQLQKMHRVSPRTAVILGIVATGIEGALVARTAHLQAASR